MNGKKSRNLAFIDGRWMIDLTFKNRRIRKFGGYSKAQAANELIKMKVDLLEIARGNKKSPSEDISFSAFCDEFLEIYAKPNKKSWKGDEFSLEDIKRHFKGKNLREIDQAFIERYKAARMTEESKTSGKKISPATVNRSLALLKTLFNKAVEWGRIETSPAARVKKLRESNGRERFLSHDEAARLLAAADPALVPILIVALGTGMRRGEILSMKWKDLDLVRGIITITDQKNGKTDKIPMSGAVAEALGGIARRGEFVFWNPETKTHRKDVKKAFGEAVVRAKIEAVRFHDLRHTAFSWMDQEGVKITTIQKIARHSSIEMTRRYIHDRPEDEREAVGKLGGILDATRRNPVTLEIAPPVSALFKDN